MRSIFLTLIGLNLVVFVVQLLWLSPPPFDVNPSVTLPKGASLRMLQEPGSADVVRPRSTPAGGDRAPAAMGARCMMVGAFAQRPEAESVVEYLRAFEINARVSELEVSDGTGFWVYLRPELSKQEALRRLYELQAKNVDSYVIPRGELANGISLGMFSRLELAQQRRAELRELGYQAEIQEIERNLREMWVILPLFEAENMGANLWAEVLARQPGLEKRQNLCSSVASG